MDVANALEGLERDQLIRRSDESDLTFLFKHGLTQETAYGSLLKTQRQHLHYAVASAIEQLFPNQLDELSNILAFHWEMAHVPERARPYFMLAGEQAARRFANAEAIDLFDRALASAENAPADQVVRIRIERARVYEFLSQYARAMEDYDAALAQARAANRQADECYILSRMAWLEWLSGHGERAVAAAAEAETRAHTLNDSSLALQAYLVRGLVAQAQGNITEAYPQLRRALFASRKSDALVQEGESLFFLGVQNNFMGRFQRAAVLAQKAYEIKANLGDRAGEIVSLYLLARAEGGRGRYDHALAALEQGLAVSKETRNPFGLAQYPNTRAWLAAELGDWKTAYELDHAGLDTARRAPVRPPEISNLINLVLDCAALHRFDEAETYVMELNQWIGRAEFGFHAWRWQIRFLDARARLLIAYSLHDQAKDIVHALMERALSTRSAKYLARAMTLQSTLYLDQENWDAATRDLAAARGLADQMRYLPLRLQTRRTLCQVYGQVGKDELAEQMRAEVEQLVRTTSHCLEHPELQNMFRVGIGRHAL